MPKFHIYKNEKETCSAFADWLVELVSNTLQTQNTFSLLLPFGHSVDVLFKTLAANYADKTNWNKVRFYAGGEVFINSPGIKNGNNVALKNFIEAADISPDNIVSLPANLNPSEAATAHEKQLRDALDREEKLFDLAIIDLNEDGSFYSMLPSVEVKPVTENWVIPVYDKAKDIFGITLTPAAINQAAEKVFLVTGKNKQEAVLQVLKGKYEPEKFTAQYIQSSVGFVHWFLDEAAAGKLIKPLR